MRSAGASFATIARELGYSRADTTGRRSAARLVKRALDATIQEPADELRTLEVERLDRLLEAMMPDALGGEWEMVEHEGEVILDAEGQPLQRRTRPSTWHVDRCLAIMERRARLLGLDAPTKLAASSESRSFVMHVDATQGDAVEALHTLLRSRPAVDERASAGVRQLPAAS